jgi:hypothetical protein
MQTELTDTDANRLKIAIESITVMSALMALSIPAKPSMVLVESALINMHDICGLIEPIIAKFES